MMAIILILLLLVGLGQSVIGTELNNEGHLGMALLLMVMTIITMFAAFGLVMQMKDMDDPEQQPTYGETCE